MKLKVTHVPQVGISKSFSVEVSTPQEAYLVSETLAFQHLWLFDNNYIPDFANTIFVSQWNEDEQDWEDFWDEESGCEWDEYVTEVLEKESSFIASTLKIYDL